MDTRLIILAVTFALVVVSIIVLIVTLVRSRRPVAPQGVMPTASDWPMLDLTRSHSDQAAEEGPFTGSPTGMAAVLSQPLRTGAWRPDAPSPTAPAGVATGDYWDSLIEQPELVIRTSAPAAPAPMIDVTPSPAEPVPAAATMPQVPAPVSPVLVSPAPVVEPAVVEPPVALAPEPTAPEPEPTAPEPVPAAAAPEPSQEPDDRIWIRDLVADLDGAQPAAAPIAAPASAAAESLEDSLERQLAALAQEPAEPAVVLERVEEPVTDVVVAQTPAPVFEFVEPEPIVPIALEPVAVPEQMPTFAVEPEPEPTPEPPVEFAPEPEPEPAPEPVVEFAPEPVPLLEPAIAVGPEFVEPVAPAFHVDVESVAPAPPMSVEPPRPVATVPETPTPPAIEDRPRVPVAERPDEPRPAATVHVSSDPDRELAADAVVLVAPVEMWFGEARVGVKPGSKTYDRFQRIAKVLFDDLKHARSGS